MSVAKAVPVYQFPANVKSGLNIFTLPEESTVVPVPSTLEALTVRGPDEGFIAVPVVGSTAGPSCDKAVSDFNEAIRFDPKLADAYINRGNAWMDKGQFDKAISDYTKAIKINPRDAHNYNNRGIAYFSKREYEKAWNDVHKAESMGWQVHPKFLKALRGASGI